MKFPTFYWNDNRWFHFLGISVIQVLDASPSYTSILFYSSFLLLNVKPIPIAKSFSWIYGDFFVSTEIIRNCDNNLSLLKFIEHQINTFNMRKKTT